jgi:hypothetical protein
MPGGIRIDFSHNRGNGSAAADGYAQIVDRVLVGGVMKGVELLDDAVHPMRKPAMLG